MAEVNVGTTCLYGISNGSVGNLFVQSYSISSSFNSDVTVQDEGGLTVTHRMDDRKSEITVEGIAKASSIPELGASFSFTTNTSSAYGSSGSTGFSGHITKVDDKGSNKGFTSVTITAIGYEQCA